VSGGFLAAGIVIPVPGFTVIGPHEAKWAHLSPGDYRKRQGKPHQVILHTTKGDWPQKIVDGKGPAGRAQRTAEFWSGDPIYSGAHFVVGSDGEIGALADAVYDEAYHATVSNAWSIGIEIYQEPNGVIYRAALDAAAALCNALSDACGIVKAYPSRTYPNAPLARMVNGGPDCYGFFGHRDNTDRRGHGDPGDAIFELLGATHGYEGLDYDARQDIEIGKRRQAKMNLWGAGLLVDGEFGAKSMAAMHGFGFKFGRELDAAVEAPFA
jgi:hypothetical protein